MASVLSIDVLRSAPTQAARRLLGAKLVHRSAEGTTSGIIVETEAYCESDPASHTFGGPTPRNRVMFGPAGHAYLYFTYGIHWCFNVVTGQDGRGQAVLIRALEPLSGLEIMARRRGIALPSDARTWLTRAPDEPETRKALIALSSGPAKLTQAMGLDGDMYGTYLLNPSGALRLHAPARPVPARRIVSSGRIGIRKATDKRWRFHIAGNPYVSR